jgi:hypothetical protein
MDDENFKAIDGLMGDVQKMTDKDLFTFEYKKSLKANIRRRINRLTVEIAKMEYNNQQWKGKYHELLGESTID